MTDEVSLERVRGCLLCGAIGDALGANVEFDSLDELRERFGAAGVTEYVAGAYPAGSITDDTQMTLFTAEGLIRAYQRWREKGICHPPSVIRGAYLRWLRTQGMEASTDAAWLDSGYLVHEPVLQARRAPGMTCLSALRAGGTGTTTDRQNDSKGCGGVMRVAPIGLLESCREAFELACDAAAITHGHPTGFLAAGAFAVIVHRLLRGASLTDAIQQAEAELRTSSESTETMNAISAAVDMAAKGEPSSERVEQLGGGWIAEEALAIALYCSLVGDSVEHALTLAVTHGGDSDSTGAICGNIVGARIGVRALPKRLLEGLEARDLINDVAHDLHASLVDHEEPEWDRYPGW